MSEIKHEPQFQASPETVNARREEAENKVGELLARVFLSSSDGRRALNFLRLKFGANRLCFEPNHQGRYDYLAAAVTDGQRSVLLFIDGALAKVRPKDADVQL